MQKITLVAAVGSNGCIGVGNDMPWHIPEDFAFFKAYTSNKPVVMGRKTWESLPKKPLPNRRNIVVSRQADYVATGAEIVPDLAAALALCNTVEEIIIMGGAQIYNQALSLATDLRLTEVDLAPEGDAFFPSYTTAEWLEQSRNHNVSSNGVAFALVHYRRPL